VSQAIEHLRSQWPYQSLGSKFLSGVMILDHHSVLCTPSKKLSGEVVAATVLDSEQRALMVTAITKLMVIEAALTGIAHLGLSGGLDGSWCLGSFAFALASLLLTDHSFVLY
jgi:hypothetical protein